MSRGRESFERGVKLTQMLFARGEISVELICERYEVSENVAYCDLADLIELLPVAVELRERAYGRGRHPRVIRLATP